jgi:hypothetical protein
MNFKRFYRKRARASCPRALHPQMRASYKTLAFIGTWASALRQIESTGL